MDELKPGQRILVRTFDETEHWIYASVVFPWPDGAGALVCVDHPGNVDHGKMFNRKREEIFTKADLVPLLEEARTLPVGEVYRGAGPERKRWVEHYNFQMSQLD